MRTLSLAHFQLSRIPSCPFLTTHCKSPLNHQVAECLLGKFPLGPGELLSPAALALLVIERSGMLFTEVAAGARCAAPPPHSELLLLQPGSS